MARQESDKEDLLREATALVERIELSPVDSTSRPNVTAGFRRDGAASIFFGADPVYHFNAAGELRRAYRNGLLYKANRGRLASLCRARQQNEVQLLSHDLTDVEQTAFVTVIQTALTNLASALTRVEYRIVGQVPHDSDVLSRLQRWLQRQDAVTVADAPHVSRRGK